MLSVSAQAVIREKYSDSIKQTWKSLGDQNIGHLIHCPEASALLKTMARSDL